MALDVSLDVLNTTLEDIQTEVVDGLYETTPFLGTCKALGKIRAPKTGTEHSTIWQVRDHSDSQQLTGMGLQRIDLSVQTTTDKVSWAYKRIVSAAVVGNKELDEEKGAEVQLRLAELRTKNVQAMMMRNVERAYVANGGKWAGVFYSMNGDTNNSGLTGGIFEDAAFGSQAGTLGTGSHTFARSTGVHASQHQYYRGTTGGASPDDTPFSLPSLYDLSLNASMYQPDDGDGMGLHLVLASTAAMREYRDDIKAREQYVNVKELPDLIKGVRGLSFEGAVMKPYLHMPAATDLLWSFAGLNLDTIYPVVLGDNDFKGSGFRGVDDRDGIVNIIKYHGNLCASGTLAANFLAKNCQA